MAWQPTRAPSHLLEPVYRTRITDAGATGDASVRAHDGVDFQLPHAWRGEIFRIAESFREGSGPPVYYPKHQAVRGSTHRRGGPGASTGGPMAEKIVESTLDDLLREALIRILQDGEQTEPSKGAAIDTIAASLTLTNPRARLSRTEGRGRLFSGLGELTWYLSGSNAVEPIAFYIPAYRQFQEDGAIHGGYGPRLFQPKGKSQIDYVLETLSSNPWSRKAVIQLFDREDVQEKHEDVPCTCTLQFLIRKERLNLVTYMRSNDAWLGLAHDIFCFTMLQEMVARALKIPLGIYEHFVGSLHLYNRNIEQAKAFLDEGWQSTTIEMPPMPSEMVWENVESLVNAEREIREGQFEEGGLPGIPYWDDLTRILWIYSLIKNRDKGKVEELLRTMDSHVFDIFISERADKL